MKELIFNYENSINKDDIKNSKGIIDKIKLDKFLFFNLPFDKENIKEIKKLSKKYKNISILILIGIGGSNLGTFAVQQSIQGKMHNETGKKPKIYYADTLDPDTLKNLIKIVEYDLKNHKEVLINCVTKSGKTTETLVNLNIFLNILKKYRKDYNKYVVLTTDKDNELWNFGIKNKLKVLEIPKNLSGRYSVFSNVGLFPLAVLGINIDKLLEGARMINKSSQKNNQASLSALSIYLSRKPINNTFLLGNDLEGFGKWYNQLMAESLGKEKDKNANLVKNGITPIITTVSTDLHSLAQLYIGGPDDKITTFISYNFNNKIKTYNLEELGSIMNSIIEGTKKVYFKRKLKYMTIKLKDKSEYSIGQLLQFKMIEMIYLAHFMNVNPFDQPNVEEYKEEVRKLL